MPDITPARDPENLGRLASALRELDARVYTESVPEGLAFDCTATTLARAEMWNLVTSAGRLGRRLQTERHWRVRRSHRERRAVRRV